MFVSRDLPRDACIVPHIHTYDVSCTPFSFFVVSVSIALAIAAAMVINVNEKRPKKASFFRASMRTFQSKVNGMIVTMDISSVNWFE